MAYPPVPIQIDSTPLYMTEQQQHRLAFVKWSLRAGYAQFSEQIDNSLVSLARNDRHDSDNCADCTARAQAQAGVRTA